MAAFSRRLDAAQVSYKGELFAAHSLASRGRDATDAERACVRDAFARIAAEVSRPRRDAWPTATSRARTSS